MFSSTPSIVYLALVHLFTPVQSSNIFKRNSSFWEFIFHSTLLRSSSIGVGIRERTRVGIRVGTRVGIGVGTRVGIRVGTRDGIRVGTRVGIRVGTRVGIKVGTRVGFSILV